MLPKDVHMLVSYLNTKLRDDDMALSHIIEVHDANYDEVMQKLFENGYRYNEGTKQIK